MDRRRKGYLLRKSDAPADRSLTDGQPERDCFGFAGSKSYDLQTQTITLGAEEGDLRCSCPRGGQTDIAVNGTANNIMDREVEFYPVDDRPSPSTFTAWDAFLAGNQAFFREPCGGVEAFAPEAAFAYMDVIPEEDDLALLESDTDDTGSSVSTVIDRFSRTSTANSSFSERSLAKCEAPVLDFDLEQVLRPFERLEKEMEEADGAKRLANGQTDSKLEADVTNCPIVVITTSSSCEDVANMEEEDGAEPSSPNRQNGVSEGAEVLSVSALNHNPNNAITINVPPSEVAQGKPKPASSKMPEKPKTKKPKTRPTSPPPLAPRKKEPYPTPSVPPRMSRHLPARRTRSDPGALEPQQPSRIPRPISRTAERAASAPKSAPRVSRSPKMGIPKKLKFGDSPRDKKDKVQKGDPQPRGANESPPAQCITNRQDLDASEGEMQLTTVAQDCPVFERDISADLLQRGHLDIARETETARDDIAATHGTNGYSGLVPEDVLDCASEQDKSADGANPFRSNDGNPFKSFHGNPFQDLVGRSNPFETTCREEKPVLHPKGQIAPGPLLMAEAPPIPQRLSLNLPNTCPRPGDQQHSKQLNSTADRQGAKSDLPAYRIDEPISDAQATCAAETFKNTDEETVRTQQKMKLSDCEQKSTRSDQNLGCSDQQQAVSGDRASDQKPSVSGGDQRSAADGDQGEMERRRDELTQRIFEQTESLVQSLLTGREDRHTSGWGLDDTLLRGDDVTPTEDPQDGGGVRPIEDILSALDHLVAQRPREVEILMEWGPEAPAHIRETDLSGSGGASGTGSPDGCRDTRQIEELLKEVDDCLRMRNASSAEEDGQTEEVDPGTADAPTVGSTSPPPGHDVTVSHDHAPDAESEDPEMLRHLRTLDPRSDFYRDGQTTVVHPRHSSGCDDSGVFLEDVLNSSPETQLRSTSRRQLSLQDDSDADDLGLASSSIDSADDLDGDPSPSTLRIEHQQPPPVPARKPSVKNYCSSEVVKRPLDKTSSLESDGSGDLKTSSEERSYNAEKTITLRSTVSRSASLGPQKLDNGFLSRSFEDEDISRGTLPVPQKQDNELALQYGEDEIRHRSITSNNSADPRKLERSSHSFEDQIMHHNHSRNPLSTAQELNNGFTSRSFDEEILQRSKQDTKSSFLARTLQPSSFLKPEHSNLKWKSEECLRTAAEVKWSLPGRRNEKAVSVKDRIAMFSEMEASQSNGKKEESPVLHRYGSENNIKVIPSTAPERKIENEQSLKPNGFSPDNKWHSMQSIALPRKTSVTEKDVSPTPLKASVNMSSTVPTAIIMDSLNPGAVNYSTLPLKLDVEPPKPIVSTYPETQLTNNKRYNYGLYSLKNLKNTEDLLSKKVSGNGLLSIIENRKQPLPKLKGLVIPDKPPLANHGKALPTIVTSKAESEPLKIDIRRCSLPATVVTTRSAKNHETLRQNSLAEPPWKSNGSAMATHNNTLPKYSPAFKRRTLELPGSSLSPTPPSSITSPLSPPPSSPSSVCSSNASSSVQQEVFQFSLSRSKPVTPLQPEKAVLSPPPSLLGAASDVEYEGDNSEDSSTSASPMLRDLEKTKAPHPHNNGLLHYEKPSTFTSTALNVTLQPMLVESLSKTSNAHARHEDRYSTRTKEANHANADPVRTEVYLSKAEILLKNDDRGAARNATLFKTTQLNCAPVDYVVLRNTTTASILLPEPDPPPGRFRAQPLKEPSKSNGPSPTYPPKGGADDSDDDSHSTLSHRTEDSRHATTDECLSDADSCDRTQGGGGVPRSPDGYLSTAESVDVPLRRYSRTPAADSRYSGEEYLSDATTDSNDWCPRVEQAKTQGYQRCSEDCPSDAPHDPDLRPRRLSQQRTVLKASQEPSGSVRKFRALAEEWEQRADAPASLSPPPPPCQAPPPPVPAKRDAPRNAPTNSIAAIILSTGSAGAKPNPNSLPPSLMPRNSASENKSTPAPPGRPPPRPPQLHNGSAEPRPGAAPLRNGWMDQELCGRFEGGEVSRRDSSSSGSNSSKTTLKDEEDLWHRSPHQIDASSTKRSETWQREAQRPRTDVVKTFSLKKGNNSRSVSDLLRSFENQAASTPAPAQPPAKTSSTEVPSKATSGSNSSAPAAATRNVTVAASRSSPEHQLPLSAEEAARLTEAASLELADDRLEVAAVALSREGGGGGSVGITLAGGADYEVKEITVHKVISGGLADRDGRIRKGDRVLSINGRSLRGVSHGEALRLLKAPSARVALVLARDRELAPTRPHASNGTGGGDVKLGRECVGKEPNVMLIEVQKDGTGLGFSIEGGKDSPLGDRPLLIKRIFKGGATEKAGQLEEGDELVSAAGQSLVSMTRTEAWNFLKKLPDGPVFVRARRPPANS